MSNSAPPMTADPSLTPESSRQLIARVVSYALPYWRLFLVVLLLTGVYSAEHASTADDRDPQWAPDRAAEEVQWFLEEPLGPFYRL